MKESGVESGRERERESNAREVVWVGEKDNKGSEEVCSLKSATRTCRPRRGS